MFCPHALYAIFDRCAADGAAERSATGLRPARVRSRMVGFGVTGQALTDLLHLLEVRT